MVCHSLLGYAWLYSDHHNHFTMILPFKNNPRALTLGVEMEVQLLDPHSLRLAPRAPEILHMLDHDKLTKEMFQSTLELITGICENVHEVHDDLGYTLKEVKVACHTKGLLLAGTGTHPFANYNNRVVSASERYHELLDRNQWLIRRMAVYGLHIHIGMINGDACIRYNNFFLHFIPHLIALSASSPYWKGNDTGLDACRPTTYEAHPTAGLPIFVDTWKGFNDLYEMLLKTHSIESMKDLWWDLRPSPGYGTLEIRICDGPATFHELECIVAFVHLLAHWYADHGHDHRMNMEEKPSEWIFRENKWRAIRYGLQAEIIDANTLETELLSDNIKNWLVRLQPYVEQLGYERFIKGLQDIILQGNSASRQRSIYAKTSEIQEVVRHNIKEFETGYPIWI